MRLGLSQGGLDKKLAHEDKGRMMFALYGIREKHAAERGLGATMERHPKFKGLPLDDAWRMALDHGVWGDGKHQGLRFENELGYMAGMFGGLTAMIQADLQGRRLDATLLGELHGHATQGVFKMDALDVLSGPLSEEEVVIREGHLAWIDELTARRAEQQDASAAPESIPMILQGYRHWISVHFVMRAGLNMTEAGYHEMLANYYPREPFYLLEYIPGQREPGAPLTQRTPFSAKRSIKLAVPRQDKRHVEATAERIIQEYTRQIESVALGNHKLGAIARCCQSLERAHLFVDGNARTVGFLSLNKLLLENGMAPAMLEDPNHFDGFSTGELVEEIKRGQATFAGYAQQP